MPTYDNFIAMDIWAGSTPTGGSGPTLILSGVISNVVTKNELSYNSSPGRSNDMTLSNDQEAFYVPTVEFTLVDVPPDSFFKLMQILNSKGFLVHYFDQELGEDVYRSVYATEQSIDALLHSGIVLDGFNGVKVKFVSRYGYPYTPRSDSNYNEANKYHMYQLHAHKSATDFLPLGYTISGKESYV